MRKIDKDTWYYEASLRMEACDVDFPCESLFGLIQNYGCILEGLVGEGN